MRKTLSVAIITFNEEANLPRTLHSVAWADEIVVVDSGSSDDTLAIAEAFGARIFEEDWQGFGRQKNFAIGKCTSDWVLSIDADEEVSPALASEIRALLAAQPPCGLYTVPRRNYFLRRWMRHGGYYPDRKLRLFTRGNIFFENALVHETIPRSLPTGTLEGDLLHHAYYSLTGYIEHMNRYSTLGAATAVERGRTSHSLFGFLWNVLLNPLATFLYNYLFRLGFLDGREGLLLHLYHSAYVSWKYAKAWESGRSGST